MTFATTALKVTHTHPFQTMDDRVLSVEQKLKTE